MPPSEKWSSYTFGRRVVVDHVVAVGLQPFETADDDRRVTGERGHVGGAAARRARGVRRAVRLGDAGFAASAVIPLW